MHLKRDILDPIPIKKKKKIPVLIHFVAKSGPFVNAAPSTGLSIWHTLLAVGLGPSLSTSKLSFMDEECHDRICASLVPDLGCFIIRTCDHPLIVMAPMDGINTGIMACKRKQRFMANARLNMATIKHSTQFL